MKNTTYCFLVFGILLASNITVDAQPKKMDLLSHEKLPSLPQKLAGLYAGVSHGALIMAGGIRAKKEFETKRHELSYNDQIFILTDKEAEWITANQRLPRPLANGVSVTYTNLELGIDGVICIGGINSQGVYNDVFLLEWDGNDIQITDLPSLPISRAYATGGVLENKLFIAGGSEGSDNSKALGDFWMMDLSAGLNQMKWLEMDPWPGPPRQRAMATVQYGGFYLFGGLNSTSSRDSEGKDSVLMDAYRFTPDKKKKDGEWSRIADIPSGLTLTSGPILPLGQSHIAFIGSDSFKGSSSISHYVSGDSLTVFTYHTVTNAWSKHPQLLNLKLRTDVATISWLGGYVLAGGKISTKGINSNQVSFLQLIPQKATFTYMDWTVLILYLVILIWIGYYFSRREKGIDDYFLGGKRVPWWAAGISIIGTGLSAISYMGTPAVIFETDIVRIVATLMYIPASILAIYFFLPFYRRLNVTTAYQYLELRFNVGVRMFVSGIFILAQLGRMAVVIYLPALALSAVTGMDVFLSIAIMGILAIAYTVLGGIEAVIWTDVLQVIILYTGAIICISFIIWEMDGLAEIINIGMEGNKFRAAIWTWDYTVMAIYIMVFGNLISLFVSYGSDQSYVQRYLTTPTEKDAAKSILTSGILPILMSPIFTFFGISLWVFYKTNPGLLHPGNNDAIVPTFIAQMLPPGLSGLIIAGIFAASMSSLDSGMHSAATAYVTDFHQRIWKKISKHASLNLARWVTVLFGLFGTGFSFFMVEVKELPIFDTWTVLINLIVGGYGGAFLLGVFTKKANGPGTFVGIFFGALVPYLVMTYTHIIFYAWAPIAIASCMITGYLTSVLFPDKEERDLAGLTIYTLNKEKRSGSADPQKEN